MNQNLRTPKVAMNNPPLNTPQSFNVWKAFMASIVLAMGLAHSPLHAQSVTDPNGNVITGTGNVITPVGTPTAGGNVVDGANNSIAGDLNNITGQNNLVNGVVSLSGAGSNNLVGSNSTLTGNSINYVGTGGTISGTSVVAQGNNIHVQTDDATCIGDQATCGNATLNPPNNGGTAPVGADVGVGSQAQATGGQSVAVGALSQSTAQYSVSLGYGAIANQFNCVALGSGTQCDAPNEVAVGNRRITQVANGVNQYDAVNVGQLYGFASSFGGGSSFNNGSLVPPSYLLGANNFYNVGDALQYLYSLDGQQSTGGGAVSGGQNIVTSTNGNNTTVSTTPNPNFTSVTTTDSQGNTTVQNGSGVTVTSANGNQVSLTTSGLNNGGNVINGVGAGQVSAGSTQAVNGSQLYQVQQDSLEYNSNTQTYDATRSGSATRISGVAPGVNPTDAINKGQLDSAIGGVKNWAQSYANDKFNSLGAMTAATANAAASFSGVDTNKKNLVSVGFGEQGGRVADAIMYQHRNADGHSAWNASVSFSQGGGTSIGVGYAIGW